MSQNFSFNNLQFNRLFPFYMLINRDLQVEAYGNSIAKLCNWDNDRQFNHYFSIPRPFTPINILDDLLALQNQLVVLESLKNDSFKLRGQFEYLSETDNILFVGSPWFGSMEQVRDNNLVIDDFARHDPLIDLLHVMKSQEITNEDLKKLVSTINNQKNQLKIANKEIHDIALFPTQNPDPLIRINLSGEIIRNNPAAQSLQFFEFENITYNCNDFFKFFIPQVDLNKDRLIFEVKSNNKEYSFVCIPMKAEGYINIYGRDVTLQNNNKRELERLSLIIQQTQNAVIVTDALGRVEWVNNAFGKVTGYTLDDMKGKTPGSMLQGKETDPLSVQYMKKQIAKAEPFVCEVYNYKKNGQGYWLRINGQPIFDKQGKVIQFFAIEEDITFEKQTQEKIRTEAARMSSLITNLHAGILLENENRTVVLVNQKYCDQFDIVANPSQMIGEDCSKASKKIKHLFANPGKYISDIEEILIKRELVIGDIIELVDGRFMERDFIPIWNDDHYEGHLWMYTEITEKITADKKLEEQRKFYEKILDNIPADIAVFDNQHRYLYVNPKGISDPELRKWLVGKKDEDYIAKRKKPLSVLEGRRNLFNNILKSKQLKSYEEELKQPDGSVHYILRNMYPVLNNNQEVELVIGYGIDITTVKSIQQQIEQSEKKYRDVIDNGLAIVTTHDLEGKFLSVNPMVGKIYGYADEDMVGHFLTEFIPEEDKMHFKKNYLQKIKRNKEATGIFRVLNRKGEIVYSLYNNFLKEEPGQKPYVIGFAVDITDRIKAEKQLKVAKKITEELAQTKQNFLANMSHEIRTPMNAIMGMSNQLAKTLLSESQKFYLNVIHSAAENLLIIINDILDLSKIDAGKLSIEKIGFEPKQVIGKVMQVMMHRAEEKGLALTNSFCDSRLSQVLVGDPYRLNQVILNLISNAIKFTEKGSVDINCLVVEENTTTQKVKVTISDTGIGMDESFVKNLFNKFSQEDESITRRFGGTGLGMSICKELIELMGGVISVNSKKGSGTSVSFTLDFDKGSLDLLPVKELPQDQSQNISGKRVLVTDDNEMNRVVASTILEEYGVVVEEAKNGKEAIEKIKVNHYDLVLMDVQMPVMDGIEATKIIRDTINEGLPIIALTALAFKGDNIKCFEAGMNDYLSKPFEESQLLYVVSKWIGKNASEMEMQPATILATVAPLYNLNKLKKISKGNDAFVKKMVALFCDQTPASVTKMKEAYANNDFKKLKALAHRIKPSIDDMGILLLKNEIRDIETNAETYQKSEQLEKLVSKVEKVINEVVQKLKYPI